MTLIDLSLSHTAQAYQSGGDSRHCIFVPSPMMSLGRKKKLDVWKCHERKIDPISWSDHCEIYLVSRKYLNPDFGPRVIRMLLLHPAGYRKHPAECRATSGSLVSLKSGSKYFPHPRQILQLSDQKIGSIFLRNLSRHQAFSFRDSSSG